MSHECTYCVLPPPPAWWCWDGQTVPWLTPQRGSPASACLCILLWESWWPHRSPSCWAASGDHCTPRQTRLEMKHHEGPFVKPQTWSRISAVRSNVFVRINSIRMQRLVFERVPTKHNTDIITSLLQLSKTFVPHTALWTLVLESNQNWKTEINPLH